jgi:hypothetical protein
MLGHLIIAAALLVFVALDLVFVNFSNTPPAALTFAVISFLILALMSASAGSLAVDSEESGHLLSWVLPDPLGSLKRVLLAWPIPASLVVAVAFVPSLGDSRDINPAVQLGSVLAVFWLLASMGLTGAVLGFLWPHTGLFEAVIVGGLLVGFQVLLTWARVEITWDELQLGLFNLMIWVSLCLIGAWVGTTLRQIAETHLYQLLDDAPERVGPTTAEGLGGGYARAARVVEADSVDTEEEVRPSRLAPESDDGC